MKSNIFTNLYQYFILNSKCPSKNHYGIPIYFCSHESCDKGYICSQCLTEDTEHFSQHVKNFIALDTKKNFFNFFGIDNLDINLYDFEFNLNYLKNSENLKHNKKITEARNLYEYIKENINNIFNDNTKNNFFENKNLIEKYLANEKEKEKKINEFIYNKINSFIKNNNKHKIIELIEEIKPYLNYIKEKNKTKELKEKAKLEKINSIISEELPKIIIKCINIFIEPENNEINIDINNINIKDYTNTLEKNKSFYEGSINNISCIKTESNIEPEEPESKMNTNNKNNVIIPNTIRRSSINDSFFKKIEEEYDNKSIENDIKNSINKLPFNNDEFLQREKILLNNKEKENLIYDEIYNNNNIYLKPTISAANNFQFYNSNNDLVNELEIKLKKIHNNNLLNHYMKRNNMNSPKTNNSVINISINNFQRKNSSNNISNININNIYKSQRERRINNNILHDDENKMNIKTKNNINRLNKIRNQIGKLIN